MKLFFHLIQFCALLQTASIVSADPLAVAGTVKFDGTAAPVEVESRYGSDSHAGALVGKERVMKDMAYLISYPQAEDAGQTVFVLLTEEEERVNKRWAKAVSAAVPADAERGMKKARMEPLVVKLQKAASEAQFMEVCSSLAAAMILRVQNAAPNARAGHVAHFKAITARLGKDSGFNLNEEKQKALYAAARKLLEVHPASPPGETPQWVAGTVIQGVKMKEQDFLNLLRQP